MSFLKQTVIESGGSSGVPTGFALTNPPTNVREGALIVEMLKMKVDPAMCMKTQEKGQNVRLLFEPFCRKFRSFARNDDNRSGLWGEKTRITSLIK